MSLGGTNGLEIPVDSAFNSELGSKIDGALANEVLVGTYSELNTIHADIAVKGP